MIREHYNERKYTMSKHRNFYPILRWHKLGTNKQNAYIIIGAIIIALLVIAITKLIVSL